MKAGSYPPRLVTRVDAFRWETVFPRAFCFGCALGLFTRESLARQIPQTPEAQALSRLSSYVTPVLVFAYS